MTWYQWATAGAAACAAVLALWPVGSTPALEPVAAVGLSTPEERPRNWHGDDDQGYVY